MTPSQLVIKWYPSAKVQKVGDKKLYEIVSDDGVLGKGQSKKAAWKAAYNNYIK